MKYFDLKGRVFDIIRRSPGGISRSAIQARLAYKSHTSILQPIADLLAEGKIRSLVGGPGGRAERLIEVREDALSL